MQIILLILRIVICVVVVKQAQKKNRSAVGWGIFAFFLPIVAWIWISCLKVNMEWSESK
jgi:hypothetical protein